ncbi:MAG: DoxX family protein [Acidimicrobiales bacterium]
MNGTHRSSASALSLAAFLLAAGAAHFVVPRPYERIVPEFLGDPAFWVRWSGVAEIACAGLVALPRTRRVGALAAAGVLVALFPANVKMALDGGLPAGLVWARLPLQIPLLVWAARVAYPRAAPAPVRSVE